MPEKLFEASSSSMDVQRAVSPALRWPWYVSVAIVLIGTAWWLLHAASKTLPDGLIFNEVRRGNVELTALGVGEFVSLSQFIVPAPEAGTITEIKRRVGDRVVVGDTLITLANPELQTQGEQAAIELRRTELETQNAAQDAQARIDDANASVVEARQQVAVSHAELDAYSALAKKGIISTLDLKRSEALAAKADNVLLESVRKVRQAHAAAIRRQRLGSDIVALAQSKSERLQHRVQSLTVKVVNAGVIKRITVHLGDAVSAGTALGEVGPESSDGAKLRFPTQYLRSLKQGVPVSLSFNGQQVQAHVQRVAPDLKDGYVMVDVTAESLPAFARVGLTVRGEASFGKLSGVLYAESAFTPTSDGGLLTVWRKRGDQLTKLRLRNVQSVGGHLIFTGSQIAAGDKVAVDPKS